ncbi:UDP-N-acetylenolpyruvoylglucosamine reductase [Sediminicola sp. YIK13]|uniref:UDP-N-acetylmuramate dehydrogenase n=1 Tax=Sediminicola sp. YIK13 TaxID=1453352 RepID=UPI00071F0D22|nr:UDP-N-acetylmuramate dehydrogenase [Sediminicola sp. YIK13]ALM06485.1 UDP-N-acetylenolpyruvoylglucosamine reductase [Sediminicola sp. YIK13]
MTIQENISLKQYNTFGIDAKARYFCEITSLEELREALELEGYPEKFILSGGSNMLITKDISALVLYIHIKGIFVEQEDENHVVLKVMAGENWHEMVLWTLDHNYGGLENLSLIPGFTGTAPIQNIGAYGVELKDCFVSCQAMDVETLELKTFTKKDCQFGYRDSFFKNEGKGKYIITSVNFRLTKKDHQLNTSYGAIETEMEQQKVLYPTIKDVSNAVVAIRKSKLPDPKELGNSGSFFKNPVLTKNEFELFIKDNPEAHYYKVSDQEYKVPAGWLIEQSGFKGKRFGDAGVHKNQALVLVNYGNASGKEIIELAQTIQKKVWDKFQIEIIPEVNIIK